MIGNRVLQAILFLIFYNVIGQEGILRGFVILAFILGSLLLTKLIRSSSINIINAVNVSIKL
ncbi:MAG: hypothetical protein QW416_04520 [Candidatus Nitrosocaldaceae archaeon]